MKISALNKLLKSATKNTNVSYTVNTISTSKHDVSFYSDDKKEDLIKTLSSDSETFNKFLILKNFSRQALHATHLGFFHPKIKKYIEFNANLPSDMENLIDLLLKY